MAPGELFVVEVAVAEAAVEDADKAVPGGSEGGVMVEVAVPELVVVTADPASW